MYTFYVLHNLFVSVFSYIFPHLSKNSSNYIDITSSMKSFVIFSALNRIV